MIEGLVIADRFRLVRPLGRGGMGIVWVAHDQRLDSPCAIKFLLTSIDDRARARFALEARSAAQLRSPNVVTVLDHGEADGVPYIAMELLDGEDLAARLAQRGRLSTTRTFEIVGHVARALARAHAAGLIHRDLKPANIFLARDDDREVVKVLDFGIAKAQVARTPNSDAIAKHDNEAQALAMTATGVSMGTPSYMSPEQIDGLDVDARTDLWALAVVTYECLTGKLPFQSESLGRLYGLVLSSKPAAPTSIAPELPSAIDAWFERALAKDRSARFASAREFADALGGALELSSGARPENAAADALVDPTASTVAAPTPASLGLDATAAFAATELHQVTPPARLSAALDAGPATGPEVATARPRSRSLGLFIGLGAASALIVGLGAAWLVTRASTAREDHPREEAPRPTQTATPAGSSSASAAPIPQAAPLPPFVPGSSAVVELAAGGMHTCARLASGAVTCWGQPIHGQFGQRLLEKSPPVMMPGVDDAVRLKAGMYSTCVQHKGGALSCFGMLGPKLEKQPSLQGDITTFDLSNWDGLCVVKPTGKVHCLAGVDANTDSDGAISGIADATDVAVGRYHVCALRRSGEVACWGLAGFFQLAGKRKPSRVLEPRAVEGLTAVVELVAGDNLTCARKRGGELVCWGDPDFGQLGAKDHRKKIKGPNGYDQTQHPDSVAPTPVLGLGPADQVDIGEHFACATGAGEVRCWGSNSWGRLGRGRFGQETFEIGSTPPPPELVLTKVKQISTGLLHACALLDSGEVHCWGRNGDLQLGVETKEFCEENADCATRPVKVL